MSWSRTACTVKCRDSDMIVISRLDVWTPSRLDTARAARTARMRAARTCTHRSNSPVARITRNTSDKNPIDASKLFSPKYCAYNWALTPRRPAAHMNIPSSIYAEAQAT